MAENPLLPDAELRALHAVLRGLSRGRRSSRGLAASSKAALADIPNAAELASALLAATVLQLRAGDIVVAAAELELSKAFLTTSQTGRPEAAGVLRLELPLATAGLAYAVALAATQRHLGDHGLVLSFARVSSPTPGWREQLRRAQTEQLPLVLVCPDFGEPAAFQRDSRMAEHPDVLTWPAVQKAAAKLQLPILSVDGEDAVAVYRIMQESALRARAGGGPAILWAALPPTAPSSRADAPLARLQRYLKARKVTLAGTSRQAS